MRVGVLDIRGSDTNGSSLRETADRLGLLTKSGVNRTQMRGIRKLWRGRVALMRQMRMTQAIDRALTELERGVQADVASRHLQHALAEIFPGVTLPCGCPPKKRAQQVR